jgi:hypothetical protein
MDLLISNIKSPPGPALGTVGNLRDLPLAEPWAYGLFRWTGRTVRPTYKESLGPKLETSESIGTVLLRPEAATV